MEIYVLSDPTVPQAQDSQLNVLLATLVQVKERLILQKFNALQDTIVYKAQQLLLRLFLVKVALFAQQASTALLVLALQPHVLLANTEQQLWEHPLLIVKRVQLAFTASTMELSPTSNVTKDGTV